MTHRNDSLDFKEVGALLYIQTQLSLCDECDLPILDNKAWACSTCCSQYVALSPEEREGQCHLWAVTCRQCALAGKPTTCPNNHRHHLQLVEYGPIARPTDETGFFQSLLAAQGAQPAAAAAGRGNGSISTAGRLEAQTVTCDCCMYTHSVAAEAVLPGVPGHVFQRPDGKWLCEWCTSWFCYKCGIESHDANNPEVDSFRKVKYACGGDKSCNPKVDGYRRRERPLGAHEVDCEGCQARIRKGQLVMEPLWEASVTCVCCGLEHDTVDHYFPHGYDRHIVEMPDGSGYVCEMCASVVCERCGCMALDRQNAKQHYWTARGYKHTKKSCQKQGKGGYGYDAREFSLSQLGATREQCRTCLAAFRQWAQGPAGAGKSKVSFKDAMETTKAIAGAAEDIAKLANTCAVQ